MSRINTEKLIFGLDIGTRSVVGTVGYKRTAREFTVVAQSTRFHESRAMLDGQIHDIAQVVGTVTEVKHELEKKVGNKLEDVCIAAAGRVLQTCQVRTDYEIGEDVKITDELIRSMELIGVEKAHQTLRERLGCQSGYFCVGYSVVKYYLGEIAISNLEGHKGSRIGADILATFLPQDVIDGLYETTSRAGLNVINLTLEPIAAINVAIPEKFRLLNLALVDVGAGTSDICITQNGSVTAYGMLPKAGDYMTEAVMQSCLVDFNTAETIKTALSSKKKKIIYKDIMGLKHQEDASQLSEVLNAPMEELCNEIAAKIAELNGGRQVSAIFIVGGGGKNPQFVKKLAKASGLSADRVALRGEEVLGDIRFCDEKTVKDSTLITPIGICLNYYEQNNNIIFVRINDELVKLYDNGRLSVIDAAAAIGFPNEKLFPRRGGDLDITVNGSRRLIRGESGDSAVITINGQLGSVSSPIVQNDDIEIRESTVGEAAHATLNELDGIKNSINFYVNGRKISCPRLVVNREGIIPMSYELKNGDEIKVLDYYTVDKLVEYMDISSPGTILVNNVIALGDEKLYENFTIDFGMENADDTALGRSEGKLDNSASEIGRTITINVNGGEIVMSGHENYMFVNVLDFYNFDTSEKHGEEVVMRVNDRDAEFTTPIADGDKIELYWKK